MATRRKLNIGKVVTAIIVIILAVLFIVVGVKVVTDVMGTKPKQVKKSLNEIKPYGYTLDDRDTALYKKYFNELNKTLKKNPIDENEYAKGLTKLFVVDFYTLSNKLTSTDIGGLEFIHKDMKDNFKLKAEETIYKTVKSDLYGEREQDLPTVSNVEIKSVKKSTFTYNEKEYVSYKVTAYWDYKEDMGYDEAGIFTLIKDKDKLNVVEEENTKKEVETSTTSTKKQ